MIDISNLTSLITAFRQETEQGSISPETLGALLQAIANEFLNASSDQDQVKLAALYENLQTMGSCLVTVAQGSTDRNNVLANFTMFNPTTGLPSTQIDTIFIKQATTERAGAMRAQQVIDLNTAKKNISTLEDSVADLRSEIANVESVADTRMDAFYNSLANFKSIALAEETVTFSNADSFGNSISGTCIRHGSVCNIFGYAYIDMEQSSIDSMLPFVADDSSQPLMNIYYEDTMQWVKIFIYNDVNGTHIGAQIPEDFMNGGEVAVHFSLTFKIKD